MAHLRVGLSLLLAIVTFAAAQTSLAAASQPSTIKRDPQAVAILVQAFTAIGGTLPDDSQAMGTFDRVAGSTTDSGSIQILTRGYAQTAEKLTVGAATAEIVYSHGYAAQKTATGSTLFSLERALSSDSAVFPLIAIAAIAQDPNAAVQLVGTETVNGASAYHVSVSRSFADQNLTSLLTFSTKDIWIATNTGLPLEIAFDMRDGDGAFPRIPAALFFSDYRPVNGIMYPFLIAKSVNGTPYMTIRVASVAFDVGLTDQDFALK